MICCGSMPALAQALQSGDPGFGKQWVRQNEFLIEGESLNGATWDFDEYFGAGMTYLMRDYNFNHTIIRPPKYQDKRWQPFLTIPVGDPQAGINSYNGVKSVSGNAGWILSDDVKAYRFGDLVAVRDYIRQDNPSQPIFTSAFAAGVAGAYYYDDSGTANYSYAQYLDDFVNILDPDVIPYSQYPFNLDGSTDSDYYDRMMKIRNKAISANLPYWAWIQSWGINSKRLPSESDMRFNLYTHLTAGYTGFLYWTYDYYVGTGNALIDVNGAPTALYPIAAQANGEVAHLGRAMRFLDNAATRFVAGQHSTGGGNTAENAVPAGLSKWTSQAGGDTKIMNLRVNWTAPGGVGTEKNGLVGLFTDDQGDRYFMLSNLNHGAGMSASAGNLGFIVTLANDVGRLYRLNRATGAPERIDLATHVLYLTLPGGTADLFKYDDGYFPGILPGDADLDDDVDLSDLGVLATSYGHSTGGTWMTGDFDLDGDIDLNDLGVLATNYGAGSAQAFADFQTLTGVPEPSLGPALLCVAAMLAVLPRRRFLFCNVSINHNREL